MTNDALRCAVLIGILDDPPPLYLSLLDQMDPSSTGTVALAMVQRTLSTSKLPASTIEKVCPSDTQGESRPSSF
jgi:hypothetical protein